ncbi:TPA: TolC family protein, partial [Acinetobacter baumannii]|nr:TolC family protein [Acinetobacter baumannii]HCG3310080.1 TolC family protein [Acinetobacter baumannii]
IQEQANTLVNIDDIAYQTANAIVNIKRYQEIIRIADQQINGIARIAEIANLRANAGISSQADPVQAQSNLEAAESNKIVQETQLKQYQQKLRNLLGYNVSNLEINIPDYLAENSGLYNETKFTLIPEMMVAQAAIQVAQYQKEQTKLSNYPTINIKGSLSQAINGRNPNNNKDDGFYNSIMLETTSDFFQGGAIRSKERAASYAEEAAKAKLNSVYLDISDQVQRIRQEIENKQKQIQILRERQKSTIRTKELYQEQYKLGTRSVVDLLNAEQAIHSAAQEIETARYDIYSNLVQFIKI